MLRLKILIQKIQKSDTIKNEDFKRIRNALKKIDFYENRGEIDNLLLDFVEFCINNDKIKTKYAAETITYIFKMLQYPDFEKEIYSFITESNGINVKYATKPSDREKLFEDLLNFFGSHYPTFKRYNELKKKFLKLNSKIKKENKITNIKFKNSLKKLTDFYKTYINKDITDKLIKNPSDIDKNQIQSFIQMHQPDLTSFFYHSPFRKKLLNNKDEETIKKNYFEKFLNRFLINVNVFEESSNTEESIHIKKILIEKNNSFLGIATYDYIFFNNIVQLISRYYFDLSEEERKDFTKLNLKFKEPLDKKALEFYIYFLERLNNYATIKDSIIQELRKSKYLTIKSNLGFYTEMLNYMDFSGLIHLLKAIKINYSQN